MLRGHSFTLGGRSAQPGAAATAPGGGAAGGGGSGVAAGAAPVVKQMNNYLGIGVDAKVGMQPASLSRAGASQPPRSSGPIISVSIISVPSQLCHLPCFAALPPCCASSPHLPLPPLRCRLRWSSIRCGSSTPSSSPASWATSSGELAAPGGRQAGRRQRRLKTSGVPFSPQGPTPMQPATPSRTITASPPPAAPPPCRPSQVHCGGWQGRLCPGWPRLR